MKLCKLPLIWLCVLLAQVTYTYSVMHTYEDLQNALNGLAPDETKVAAVENLFFEKEGGVFSIESGKIYFFKPLFGRVCVAVFIGNGTFSFSPPTAVEKLQLERFYKTSIFEKNFKSLVIFFTDDFYDYLKKYFTVKEGVVDDKAGSIYNTCLKYLINKKTKDIDSKIAKHFLEPKNNGLFFAQINTGEVKLIKECYFWVNDPLAEEEIQFLKGNYHASYGLYTDLVNQFHCLNEINNPDSALAVRDEINIDKYTINCNIDNSLELSCKAKVDFIALADSVNWIEFSLHEKFDVDSVVDQQGNNLYFRKAKESDVLWVRFNEPQRDSVKYTITFYYKGKYIQSSSQWYPRYGYREKAFFDMEYTTPKNLKFCSVGEIKSRVEGEDFNISRWISNKKMRNVPFIIGDFREKIFEADSLSPEIYFYYQNFEQLKPLIDDIKLSINFFDKIFGEYVVDRFNVTEIFGFYGEAFPGMLHLSFTEFISGSNDGSSESFCSHEVAHQWWGIGVDFVSYRDQWLSEGFAEYSSLLYTQMSLKDNEKFFKIIKQHKKDLMGLRKSFLYDGVKAGPVSLGYRNESEATRGDYSEVVYKKGAWVLHMLRNMLIDFKTMDESLFMKILKDFFTEYKDKHAETKDFINVVNRNTGADFTWFFNQWVDKNDIPKYTFGYKTEKTPEGKYKVRCRIKQEEVPANFQVSVPVKIDFGDNRRVYMRVNVVQPFSEFDFPLMPLEPEKIEFNTLESVLCDVEYDDYEDIKQ